MYKFVTVANKSQYNTSLAAGLILFSCGQDLGSSPGSLRAASTNHNIALTNMQGVRSIKTTGPYFSLPTISARLVV